MGIDSLISSMIQTTRSPNQMHSIWVHFPVAASVLGLVLLIALICTGVRSGGMRWACFILYALGAGAAFMAFQSGSEAAGNVSTTISDAAQPILQTHAEMGEKVWVFLAVTAAFVALTVIRRSAVRSAMTVLAVLAALSSLAWVGVTAHYGGTMVYQYGVGVGAPPHVKSTTSVIEKTVESMKASSAGTESAASAMQTTSASPTSKPAANGVGPKMTISPATRP